LTPTSTPTSTPMPQSANWLAILNGYRTSSQLPPLTENTSWSEGCWLHARYMVKNDVAEHRENTGSPWYTPAGSEAAENSNIYASTSLTVSDATIVDTWMTAVFHAVSILDPRLQRTAFGSFREAGSGYRSAAVLDILRGRGDLPPKISFPILWPGSQAVVPLRFFWLESPSPLTSCPGYAAPSGLPIIAQMGAGDRTPHVTAHSFSQDGVPLEHCVFDETTYSNPDVAQQNLGRLVLAARDAVVLLPRAPLRPGESYTVSLTVDGQTYAWSFTVANAQ
jgi:hypothetical protein